MNTVNKSAGDCAAISSTTPTGTDAAAPRARMSAASVPGKMLYLFVLIAITTGARRGEIESLRWSDVDFENAVATIPRQTKNGDSRTHAARSAWLAR